MTHPVAGQGIVAGLLLVLACTALSCPQPGSGTTRAAPRETVSATTEATP